MIAPDATKHAGAPTPDRPVYLLSREAALAEALAHDLRHRGVRARTFINLEVLRNAGRSEKPLAVVLDLTFAAAHGAELKNSLSHGGYSPALLFLGTNDDFTQRLQAVRAGGSGYYSLPVNRSALLHQLMALSNSTAASPGKILLIDDKQGLLREAQQALLAAGFDARRIDQPQRTLHELQHGDFDLLLMNDTLDDMRGAEVLHVVRQSMSLHALPAIILTRGDKRRLDEEATAAGADALLGLPVAPTDLVGVVRAKLQRARRLFDTYGYSIRRDPASGLFNQSYFMDALRQAVSEATAGHGRAALLWLDAEVGTASPAQTDALFVHIADLLAALLPPLALPARFEDGVAILLPDPGASTLEGLLEAIGEQLRQLQKAPTGRQLELRCGLGATLLTNRQRSPADAVALARQAASLRPKQQAEGGPAVARASDDGWTSAVKNALQENRFRLVYQPIASLSGQPTSFYEVFVRMLAADGRDILPQEFLGPAERGGLTEQLDRWVLARAVHVLESQRDLRDKPTLFVKVFPDSIGAGRSLAHWLGDQIRHANLDANRLVLQIRQDCAATRQMETRQFAAAARELGCLIALEHFDASGDAAQQLLHALRPDFVRLSPRLTQDIGTNREHQKVVEMIAGQCRSIGARPIAALVQEALNLSVLWRCGVEYIQGYFMQEPADVFSADASL
jgi:EAL domain-containing protein (putative c-di-GMP-specific phosphodiesterase class I)/DNA-binding response OmpR family regulator